MSSYVLGCMFLLPLFGKAQTYSPKKASRSLISSLDIGATLYHTNVFETALLVGLKDNDELSAFEIGYVYKRIINKNIGHSPSYHGIRGAIEVNLYSAVGAYGTYDIIKGKRWLYDDVFGKGLQVHDKIHGEGTLGFFFAPKLALLKFYGGIEPQHYNPAKVKLGKTPHKSWSINLKVKYTIGISQTKFTL